MHDKTIQGLQKLARGLAVATVVLLALIPEAQANWPRIGPNGNRPPTKNCGCKGTWVLIDFLGAPTWVPVWSWEEVKANSPRPPMACYRQFPGATPENTFFDSVKALGCTTPISPSEYSDGNPWNGPHRFSNPQAACNAN